MIYSHKIKVAFLAGILACFSVSARAQDFYGKIGGGYSIGIGGNIRYSAVRTVYTDQSNSSSITEEPVNFNYGKGTAVGATLGYNLREHLALELGLNYLLGGKNEVSNGEIIYDPSAKEYPEPRYNLVTTQTHARMFLFQPALVVQGTSDYLNPYARFGVMFSNGKILETYRERKAQDLIQKTELSGGIGFGFQGAMGASLKLSENLNLFMELTFSNFHYAPKEGEITSRTLDGQNNMFMLSREEINFKFVDKPRYGTTNMPFTDPYLKKDYTFSNAGLHIGLKYNF